MSGVGQGPVVNSSTPSLVFTTTTYDDEPFYMCPKEESIRFGAAIVPGFYYTVFAISLLGNGLILFLLLKFENVKTVTNLFIFNLVISDLLFTASLPFWGYYHNHQWIFGDGLCKVVSSVFYIGFYSCMLFLTIMTIDRYMAVVHAIYAARTRNLLYVYVASAIIWIVSIFSTIPKFVLYGTRNDTNVGMLCEETGYEWEKISHWKEVGYYQHLFMFFLIPLLVILYCYAMIIVKLQHTRMHNKDKAMKLIFAIVLAFFLCWVPYNIVLFIKAKKLTEVRLDEECSNSIDYAFYICRNIAYFHCCINPFFYTFFGTKFRKHLSSLFGNWIMCGSRYRHSSWSSRTSEYSPQTTYE